MEDVFEKSSLATTEVKKCDNCTHSLGKYSQNSKIYGVEY